MQPKYTGLKEKFKELILPKKEIHYRRYNYEIDCLEHLISSFEIKSHFESQELLESQATEELYNSISETNKYLDICKLQKNALIQARDEKRPITFIRY